MSEKRVSAGEFRRLWADRGLMIEDVAARLGIHVTTATRWARRLGLPSRHFRVSDAAIRAAWARDDLSTQEVADMVGLTRSNLWRRVAALGLPPRSRARRDCRRVDAALFEDMWRAGVSSAEIGAALGWHPRSVQKAARRRGLPPRPQGGWQGLSLAAYAEIQMGRALAARAKREEAALKAAGLMNAPGVSRREAA